MTLLEKIAEFGHAVSLRADDEANRLYDEIAAALSAQARASEAEDAPEGWKLVPVEPTYAMLRAYATCWQGFVMRGTELGTRARHEWKAMLDAAPDRATQGDAGSRGETPPSHYGV